MVIAILSYSLPNLIAYTEILFNYVKLIFSEKWYIQPKRRKNRKFIRNFRFCFGGVRGI